MLAIVGPGHRPASPHPTPNITAPALSLVSIRWLVGIRKSASNSGFSRLCTNGYSIAANIKAEPITNASDGSQFPKTSRKPITFADLSFPKFPNQDQIQALITGQMPDVS